MKAVIGKLVVFVSPDGDSNWQPVKPEDVPEWLKDPGVLGQMVEGFLAHNREEEGAPWFAAVTVPERSSKVVDLHNTAVFAHARQELEDKIMGANEQVVEAGGEAPPILTAPEPRIVVTGGHVVEDSATFKAGNQ